MIYNSLTFTSSFSTHPQPSQPLPFTDVGKFSPPVGPQIHLKLSLSSIRSTNDLTIALAYYLYILLLIRLLFNIVVYNIIAICRRKRLFVRFASSTSTSAGGGPAVSILGSHSATSIPSHHTGGFSGHSVRKSSPQAPALGTGAPGLECGTDKTAIF